MKLHQDNLAGYKRFTGYGEGYVAVDGERLESSLILFPESICVWSVPGFEGLEPLHFQLVLDAGPEILILGTGRNQRFPHPGLFQRLHEARIGVEIMDTSSAARTYNILAGEGRHVAAALIIDRPVS